MQTPNDDVIAPDPVNKAVAVENEGASGAGTADKQQLDGMQILCDLGETEHVREASRRRSKWLQEASPERTASGTGDADSAHA